MGLAFSGFCDIPGPLRWGWGSLGSVLSPVPKSEGGGTLSVDWKSHRDRGARRAAPAPGTLTFVVGREWESWELGYPTHLR